MPARNVSVQYLERRIEVLQAELEAKLVAESIEDTFKNGDVLRFTHVFPTHPGQEYTYVVLKVNDRWYLTGKWSVWMSWPSLVEKFGPNTILGAQRATTWKKAF